LWLAGGANSLHGSTGGVQPPGSAPNMNTSKTAAIGAKIRSIGE
jgi:hypothetical protein